MAKRKIRMHRRMWEMVHGPIPDGMSVLHSCDVRSCCNPDHLRIGTQTENIADMDTRGRRSWAAGVNHPNAKLSSDDVRYIRQSNLTLKELSEKFGMGTSQLARIGGASDQEAA